MVFKAIEVKNDKRFEEDLLEFIRIGNIYLTYKAEAIYALAKIGSKKDTQKLFNELLMAPAETPGHGRAGKPLTLRYMKELGFKPSNDAIKAVKADITGFLKQKYPALALNLAAPLKLHGVDLSGDEKKQLAELVSNHWRNVDPDEMKIIGIQPDWETMFSSKDASVQHDDLMEFFIKNADLQTRRDSSKLFAKIPTKGGGSSRSKTIVDASANDKTAIETLLGKFTLDHMMVINSAPSGFSDEILIQTLQKSSDKYWLRLEKPIFDELKKRGRQDAIDTFVAQAKQDASVEMYKRSSRLIEEKKIYAASSIAQYDAGLALDLLSKQLEKYPNDSFVAYAIATIIFTADWPGMESPGWKEWVKKNPEKLAKAVKTLIDTSDEKTLKKQYDAREGGFDEWTVNSHREVAFELMPFITDEMFNKYLADIESQKLTKSSYVVGNFFGAKWAREEDQESFYRKYSFKAK
jgi:hypothetical protein